MSGLSKNVTFDEINEAFDLRLKEDYHNKVHGGIDGSPMDRYRTSLNHVTWKSGVSIGASWTRHFLRSTGMRGDIVLKEFVNGLRQSVV